MAAENPVDSPIDIRTALERELDNIRVSISNLSARLHRVEANLKLRSTNDHDSLRALAARTADIKVES
ncbi:MAG: hypothetical protein UY48_C0005G0021 [Candidatus Gottesmanbacteria bacterium GW2011_GWB1_49_7]|uniref:Uncharacterized protein n=1 Tax=Candidatus Gottesmanbacteria bacterium GW2011_GWB1_49_7 TaxID=1618448 RepID=A0A0G1W3A4_9BACT|nr:MAG: hypothetical protein UY48_C0005G0021 [Candidatus Gottesmanbacteria bacterium GW2011_GWB1_49_7]